MSFDFTEQDHVAKDVFTHMLGLWKEAEPETDSVEEFVAFAKDYLATNRPVQSFQPEANIGVVLANNIRLVLSPPSGELLPGDMASVAGGDQGSIPMRGDR